MAPKARGNGEIPEGLISEGFHSESPVVDAIWMIVAGITAVIVVLVYLDRP